MRLVAGSASRILPSTLDALTWGFDPEIGLCRVTIRRGVKRRPPELPAPEVLSAIAKTGSLNAARHEVGTGQVLKPRPLVTASDSAPQLAQPRQNKQS